jgi:hypothetical protein
MQFFCKMIILMGHEKILLFLKGIWYSNFTSKFEADFFQYYANKFPLPPSFHDKLSRKGPTSAKFQNLKCLAPLAKGHASVCHPSLTSTCKSPLNQVKPNLAVIVLGRYPFTIVLDSPALHSRWRPLLNIEISYASSGTFHQYLLSECKTRGSQEPVITHLVFNWHLKLIENGGVTHNFESGPPKDHFNSNFWAKDFDVIFIS